MSLEPATGHIDTSLSDLRKAFSYVIFVLLPNICRDWTLKLL